MRQEVVNVEKPPPLFERETDLMDAETHANTIRYFPVALFLIGFPLLCILSEWGGGGAFLLGGATIILIYYILWSRPVHCQTPGCNGLMEKTRSQISGMKAELQYRCPICNSVYTCQVYSPDRSLDI